MPVGKIPPDEGYATHQRLLVKYALMAPEGSTIVEMGCGRWSTIILSQIAASRSLRYVVYTTDEAWANQVKPACTPGIEWNFVRDWKQWKPTERAFMYMLDNEELMVDRFKHIPALQGMSDYVLVHDADVYPKRGCTLPNVAETDTTRVPHTAVLSGLADKVHTYAVLTPSTKPPVPYQPVQALPIHDKVPGPAGVAQQRQLIQDGVISNMPPRDPGLVFSNVRKPLPEAGLHKAPVLRRPAAPDTNVVPIAETTQGPLRVAVACCYVSGGDYDAHYREYIGRLAQGIADNTTEPTDFFCVTNMDIEGIPGVQRILPKDEGWKGWHIKAELFREDLWQDYDRVLYVDLDTVITGNIDDILADGSPLVMLRDFYQPQQWETGMIYFDPRAMHGLYGEFVAAKPKPHVTKDATLISNFAKRRQMLPKFFQDSYAVGSYKVSVCRDMVDWRSLQVVCFHGKPRPHEVGWNLDTKHRQAGPKGKIVHTPVTVEPLWQGEDVFIIGGGPSLKGVDLDKLLEGHKVIGVNDAYVYDCADILFFGDTAWYAHHREAIRAWGKPIYSTSGVVDDKVMFMNLQGTGLTNERNRLGWNSCSGWAALNLALHLGAARVFLLGFDMSFGKDGESNWHPNIRQVNRNSYEVFLSKQQRIHDDLGKFFPDAEVFVCLVPGFDSGIKIFPKILLHELLDTEPADLYLPDYKVDAGDVGKEETVE